MNKIYKVIWSKAKNCYVVASELAKSHTKAPASGVISRTIVAGVLACVLSIGYVNSSYAFEYIREGGATSLSQWVSELNLVKIGNYQLPIDNNLLDNYCQEYYDSRHGAIGPLTIYFDQNNDIWFAAYASVYPSTDGYTNTGHVVFSYDEAIGIGLLPVNFESLIPNIYNYQQLPDINSVNVGRKALAFGGDSVALGTNSTVNENASDSVALGSNSVADVSNVISVGNDNLKRKIVNVAEGTISADSSEAVTGSQLHTVNQAVNTLSDNTNTALDNISTSLDNKANIDASNITDDLPWANVLGKGEVAQGNGQLVTGGAVHNALSALSSDIDTALSNKANISLDNVNNAGKSVIRGIAQQSVKVVPGTNTNVTVSAEGSAITYAVDVATNGTISDSSEGIVSGKTVYEEVHPTADGNYIRTDFTAGSNLKALDDQVKANADAIQVLQNNGGSGVPANMVAYDDESKGTITLARQDGTTIKNVKAGVDATDAVNLKQLTDAEGALDARLDKAESLLAGDWNGKTVKEAVDSKLDVSTFDDYRDATANTVSLMNNAIQDKSNKDLDNISDSGKAVVRNLAQEAIDVQGEGAATVTSAVEGNKKVFTVSVATDGVVESGNTGIVTGNAVYNALQEANTATQVALNGKANASLDNITDDGKAVIRNVVADDFNNKANIDLDNISDVGRNVIRDAVKDDFAKKADKDAVYSKEETDGLLADKADISYVDAGLSAKADITYVDFELGKKADKIELDKKADIAYVDNGLSKKADKSELATKANADGSNIDIAKWSESLGDGVIEEGNTSLVNGGTVYEALQSVSGNDMIASDFETGTIHIGGSPKYDELRAIDFSTSDGNGRVLTGVVTNPYDATSAANVGYVNAVGESIMDRMNRGFDETNKRTNKVGAGASAMASLMPAPMDGDEKWSFSAAVGNYKNETAAAVGAFFRPTDNVIFNLRGTVGSDENMVGGGVSVALQRGNTPGVSKAQLVKTINTQAGKIQEMEANYNAKISEMEARHNAEMAKMEERIAMMEEMINKHN